MWNPFRKKPKRIVQRKPGSLSSEVAALVERARLGDQNAMAMIHMVNENSNKGVSRARVAKGMIQDYISKNPVVGLDTDQDALSKVLVRMVQAKRAGQDEVIIPCILKACTYVNGFCAAALVLSYLGTVSVQAVQQFGLSSFGSEGKTNSFFWGVQAPGEEAYYSLVGHLPPDALNCTKVGQCFGCAAQLQRLRSGKAPIKETSPSVAWELGE